MKKFDFAFANIRKLVKTFQENEAKYKKSKLSEAAVRKDFIDKFWHAMDWDVNHDYQTNPYEQEVRVEKQVISSGASRRADYAFYLGPNFHDVKFFVEAKRPFSDLETNENYFQLIRYAWNSHVPLAVLMDFEQLHILDCRFKPDLPSSLNRIHKKFHYSEYADRDKLLEIYWYFSREAVSDGSIEKRAKDLPKPRGKAVQRGLFAGGYQTIDESFLAEFDKYRLELARAFKAKNPALESETLTELAQRTLDRLVFLRFLEDKGIESQQKVQTFGDKGSTWADFIAESKRLNDIYNGVVYRRHTMLDDAKFKVDDKAFAHVCEQMSPVNSAFDFNAIPIHILGSIYERFLGKVIVATDKSATVEEKPEVRKAGGVYYTPEYIVRYIVENTVGKLIAGKTPAQIAEMRFADIACGSGSFLLGVFDLLLKQHSLYYNANPAKARKGDCAKRDGVLYLSINKKREILLNNIYGVDIDNQAVEVCQLSLYLKLLQDETEASTHQHLMDFAHEAKMKKLLPDLSSNIVCGNSLIGTDITDGKLFSSDEEKKLNAMDFEVAFPEVMKHGGFDAIVGNPPYLYSAGQAQKDYFKSNFHLSEYQTDFYVYFIERAIEALNSKAYLGMIVSDSWIKGKYFTKLRDYLLRQTRLESVTVFDYPPFKGATIENSILVLQNSKPVDSLDIHKFRSPTDLIHMNRLRILQSLSRGFIDIHDSVEISQVIEKLEKNCVPLSSLCNINRGIHAYRTDGYGLSKYSGGPQTRQDKDEQSYHSLKKLDATYMPEIKGKHLDRYSYRWDGTYVSYGNWLAEPRSPEFFTQAKLAIRKIIAPRLICTLIDQPMVLDQSIYVVIRKAGVTENLPFLLGILASSVAGWYIQKKHSIYDTLYPWFTKEQLAEFPIPQLDKSRHDEIVSRVTAIVESKRLCAAAKTDKDRAYYSNKFASLDRQIDQLVYELYGLTDEEIAIVEAATADKTTKSSHYKKAIHEDDLPGLS